ncbi:hypothetical protein C1645_874644 [Glomus cerebriforme]|uniref:Uncharacterized protein n=1 Tax=Glomus cerebriforme TaxID=658196 RepID=A0A397T2S7_9GLOM|nr:hypothetical protein C1645_874644 [Glomus cerebriforme]
MEPQYSKHLISFLLGLASMAYFHNVFVSIFLYKSGHPNVNVSNMLKIIFNLSGVSRSVITYVAIMVMAQCALLSYLTALSNFFYRSSLSAFLLWRLKQIEYSTWDRWISSGLFFIRTILNILVISILHPTKEDCDTFQLKSTYFQLGFIGLDLLIDTFVTIRLVQILNDGNRNSAEVTSIIGHNNTSTRRTTLFTAVLYWNFLRLTIDFLYNGITILTLLEHNIDKIIIESLLCFVTISQSYLITVDAEIVKVIEGRNINDFNQNDLEWLNGNGNNNGNNGNNNNNNNTRGIPTTTISIPSSRTQAAARSVSSIYHRILQRTTSSNNISNRSRFATNTHSWFTTSSYPTTPTSPQHNHFLNPNLGQNNTRQLKRPTDTLRHTASYQLDKGKFVVVSMQRLTFFEWANMVTGHNDNINCGKCVKCSTLNNNISSPNTPIIEEIPDIPPLPIQLQDQIQFNQPHRQFTQPQRQQPQRQFTNQYHQRQISQDDAEALLPSLAYIPQSRRGSNTSTMTNSTSQTKTNNDNPTTDNYKFI